MRKSILSIAAAGSVFALTAAGAAANGTMLDTASGTGALASSGNTTFALAQCQDAFTLAYTYDTNELGTVVSAVATGAVAGESESCGTQSTLKVNQTTSSGSAYSVVDGKNVITYSFSTAAQLADGVNPVQMIITTTSRA